MTKLDIGAHPGTIHLRCMRLLDAAIGTLREEILPHLVDEAARIKVDHVTRLVRAVAMTLSERERGLRAFLADAVAVTGTPTQDAAGADMAGDLEGLERRRLMVEAKICEMLPGLVARATAQDRAALAQLRAVLELEKRFYISQDPDVAAGSGVVYRGGRIEDYPAAGKPPVDAPRLTHYLRDRLQRDTVAATDVTSVPGGFSKETIFFSMTDAAEGSTRPLVMRKDLPIPLIGKTVVNEFDLLRQLFARGFPVAEPLWLERDVRILGSACLVSGRVRGTSDVARWASDPLRARAACRQLAQILARLHAFDPRDLGFDAAASALSAGVWMEREIAQWIALFHAKRAEAFPLQELPLIWLAANIPRALYQRPARIVHGDAGFHNMMFDEAGAVTALLDWEFSVLGDPTQDLCFVRQFVESLMPWADFLRDYCDAGGLPPCEEAEFFYRLWTKTRNAVGTVDAQVVFDTSTPAEPRLGLAGHVFAPYMFVDQCETLLAHLSHDGIDRS